MGKNSIATIFHTAFESYVSAFGPLPYFYYKVAHAIMHCRTAVLGGHRYRCEHCGHEVTQYNSCRNRHCPLCQGAAGMEWVQERVEEVLPVPYFHVVFTIPLQLREFALRNKKAFYSLHFRAVSQTLVELGHNPKRLGGTVGFFAILHTWTQKLIYHPHIHCVIPAGALSVDRQKWICCRKDFLFPVKVVMQLYRGKMMDYVVNAWNSGQILPHGSLKQYTDPDRFRQLKDTLYKTNWVVYLKRPFSTPENVIKYLSSYTHRTAITNRRIAAVTDGNVTFQYKDRRDDNRMKVMTLSTIEFIHRLLTHVLPNGFKRIRYYGLYCNRLRKELIPLCRKLLGVILEQAHNLKKKWHELIESLTGKDPTLCPCCGKGRMTFIKRIPPMPALIT